MPEVISLETALAEINAWEGLQTGQREPLSSLGSGLAAALRSRGVTQFIKSLPSAQSSRIGDLRAVQEQDGSITLSWSYSCTGDYDQNGEVNVSDLSPLGQFYGRSVTAPLPSGDQEPGQPLPPAEEGAMYEPADGNGDGLIGITDITPIGQNFFASVTDYAVYSALVSEVPNTAEHGLIPLATVAVTDSGEFEPSLLRRYSVLLPASEQGRALWVQPRLDGQVGALSNVVVAGGQLPADQLAAVGMQPSQLRAGQLFTIEFNSELGAASEDLELSFDDLGISPSGSIFISGNLLQGAVPLLGAGTHFLTVLMDGNIIGTFSYVELSASGGPSLEEFSTVFESGMGKLDLDLDAMLQEVVADSPEINEQAAQEDITALMDLFAAMQQAVTDSLAELDEGDQAQVLAFYQETGLLRLLESLDDPDQNWLYRIPSVAGKQGSALLQDTAYNEAAFHYDYRSMMLTNYEMYYDAGALGATAGAALVSGPGAVFVGASAYWMKALLLLYDMVLDTWIATDIYELRVNTQGADFELLDGGPASQAPLVVEGYFCGEQEKVYGTLSDLVDAVLPKLLPQGKVSEAAFTRSLELLKSELKSRIATLGKRLIATSLAPVNDPASPAYGKVGGIWRRLDMALYSYSDPYFLHYAYTNTLIPGDWDLAREKSGWYANQSIGISAIVSTPGFPDIIIQDGYQPDNNSELLLQLSEFGESSIRVTVVSFNENNVGWFYDETKLTSVVRDFDFEVIDPVAHWYFQRVESPNFIGEGLIEDFDEFRVCRLDGKPAIFFSTPNGTGGQTIFSRVAKDAYATDWWDRSTVYTCSDNNGYLRDLALIAGKPVILTHVDAQGPVYHYSETRLFIANDPSGLTWPASGQVVYPVNNDMVSDNGSTLGSTSVGPLVINKNLTLQQDPEFLYKMTTFRALDQEAVNWQKVESLVQLQSSALLPAAPGLVNIGGLPSLLYMSDDYLDNPLILYFVQANDTAASSWKDAVVVDVGLAEYAYLAEVNGKPAIVFRKEGEWPDDYKMYYSIASDVEGTSWSTPTLLFDWVSGYYSNDTSNWDGPLAVVGGRPASIIYNSKTSEEKDYYMRWALDADGTVWGPLERIYAPSASLTGGNVSVFESEGGYPAVVTNNGDAIWFGQRSRETPYPWPPE